MSNGPVMDASEQLMMGVLMNVLVQECRHQLEVARADGDDVTSVLVRGACARAALDVVLSHFPAGETAAALAAQRQSLERYAVTALEAATRRPRTQRRAA